MARDSLEKARRLRQSGAIWQCTVRRAPTWLIPKGRSPYRPYVVLVLAQDTDCIRRVHFQEDRPTPDEVLDELLRAMLSPLWGSGGRGRPERIVLDAEDIVQALAPQLAGVDVHCDYHPLLPLVDAALRDMEAHMNKRGAIPGLLSVPGVTLPLVGELFAAAAAYYRQQPWRWMDNSSPVEVRYPSSSGRARYAVVLGGAGEVFGLSLYESLRDLRVLYGNRDSERLGDQIHWLSLIFEEPMAMAFDDLDALEKYGWPIGGERGYPFAVKVTSADTFAPPSASELAWLVAAVRVVPDFVTSHLHADEGLPRPAQATYRLPGVHGGQEIALRYPVDLRWPPGEGPRTIWVRY